MKIRTAKQKIAAAASAKKQAVLKTVSFVLAMAITVNSLSISASAMANADLSYNESTDIFLELPDSAELERTYIDRLFYGDGVSVHNDSGKSTLNGTRLEIYEYLRREIERIAAGKSTETVFSCELSAPYDDSGLLRSDLTDILRCIIADVPEAFYWYDRTKGFGVELGSYNDGVRDLFDKFTLSFAVSEKYADKNSEAVDGRLLAIDPAKINSVKKAVENAQKIAADCDDMSYYEKILAYKSRICDFTEYDRGTADRYNPLYGDPWQIVYVFDGDPYTNADSEGYARAFQYLCDLGRVKCCTVTGSLSSDSGAHMWNIVSLQGRNYLADIANCDGSVSGGSDSLLLKGASVSNENGCSFNIGTYTYDADTLSMYTADILTVSEEDFNPDIHYDHMVCDGADNCPDSVHAEHMNGETVWEEWSETDRLPDKAGRFYLGADITLTESWVPMSGTVLCLNGHTVNGQNLISSSSIVVNTGRVFTLCDCTGGGKISGKDSMSDGGGVRNYGTLNMFSGKISENTAAYGGGVCNIGTFNMYGGRISGNTADNGKESEPSEEENGETNTEGSGTDENTWSDDTSNIGTFNMLGGMLIGNTSTSSKGGGGVYTCGRIVVGGNAVIKDNTYGDNVKNNLFVRSGIAVAPDGDNPLSRDAYIGITTKEKPTEGSPVNITEANAEDYSRFFRSDDPRYSIVNGENNVIQLVLNVHRHSVCNGASCPDDIHGTHGEVDWIPWEGTDSLPSEPGYYYLTDDVMLTETWEPADGTSLCLNGYIVSVREADSEIININDTFDLCDCTNYGKIRGNGSGGSGVRNGGTFNMYSGEISGNNSDDFGGGVINDSTGIFNMYGGKIIKNAADIGGGGVYSYNIFNMYGGEISGNNASAEGGGVSFMDTFNMYGGKIVENTAEQEYGGVGVYSSYSGSVRITLGGDAVINNNKCGGVPSNLFISEAVAIDENNPLAENAHIGITAENEPTEDYPVYITGENNADFSGNFSSDNHLYRIKNDENNAVVLSIDDSHKHTVCEGTGSCTDVGHDDEHTDIIWKAWSETDRLPDTEGNYYLTANVTLTDSWAPSDGTSLCLNGFTISAQNAASGIIYIENGVTFTLTDCTGVGKISGNTVSVAECGGGITNKGTFNMYGGEITENTASAGYENIGGGVYNHTDGVFNMYGGKIIKNNAEKGAGVYNAGEFSLYGGAISENAASVGGGVYNDETFDMHGGVIIGNTADEGAGAYIVGTMNMYGGEISGNIASGFGGGVNIANETPDFGGLISAHGTLNMYGGRIFGNSAEQGGGVCAYNGDSYGNVILGGNPVIENNVPDNLYINDIIALDTDKPLSEGAYIGVTTAVAPTDGNPVNITGENQEDYKDFFFSDNPEFKIICEGGFVIRLVADTYQAPHNSHKVCGEDGCTDDSHADILIPWTETDRLPDTAGEYYLVYNVTLTESWEPADGTTLCLNGHTVSAQNAEYGIINILPGTVFNLCDCTENGRISGNNSRYGGIYNEGTFNMYSGEISHNTSLDGGGVNNYGEFNLYGGRIVENSALTNGGGVFNDGTFNIYGGAIGQNTAEQGGGVDNSDIGSLYIYGGRIIENTASIEGGGVYTQNDLVTIGGNAYIMRNRCGDELNNLYIYSGEITLSETDPLNGDIRTTRIGITTEAQPTEGAPVSFTGENITDYKRFFYSDNPNYDIENEAGYVLQLVVIQPHNLEYHEAKEPTCTENGNKEYWQCVDCGKIYADENRETELEEIPVIEAGHKYGKWNITVLPTETTEGEAERICERDESHIDRVTLPVLLDETVWTKTEDVKPTCAAAGKRVYTNEDYGTVTVTLDDMPDHEYEDPEEAWHTDPEKHWHECKNCGAVDSDTEAIHVWGEGEVTIEPTEESEGERTYTCGVCGYVRTETIPKLGDTETEEPPVTPSSSDETEEPPLTPPSSDETEEPPVTPPSSDETEEPPVTPPSSDETEEPPVTPPSSDETEEPPVTPPSSDETEEPPVTPPSSDETEEPPVTPPSSDETEEPPVTPPSSDETEEPPVTPPSDETEPPVTPPSETEPPVTPPIITTAITTYRFVVPTTSGTTAAEQTTAEQTTTEQTTTVPTTTSRIDPNAEPEQPFSFITENTTIPPQSTIEEPVEIKTDIISKRVESVDYIVEISDNIQELADNILEQLESDLINADSMVEILLTTDRIGTVPESDETLIRETLGEYSLWQYLDINLYTIVDGTQYQLSSTNVPITIKIVIPEALRKSGREYALVRVHDGLTEIMEDLDNSTDTITFTTDKFSVYAFVYKDKAAEEKAIEEDGYLNTGVDSYTTVFLAVGITALAGSMTLTVMGTGIIGMSEERKNRLYEKLIRWGKGGGKIRKAIALALIFLLLRYYYSTSTKNREETEI